MSSDSGIEYLLKKWGGDQMKRVLVVVLICLLVFTAAVSFPTISRILQTNIHPKAASVTTGGPDSMPAPISAIKPDVSPQPAPQLPSEPFNKPETEEENLMATAADELSDKVDTHDNSNTYGRPVSKEKKRFYIMVNYSCNTVNVYEKDENGNYSLPYKAMVCSTGTATPKSGVYHLGILYRWQELFGNVYGQYCTQITGNILFHSVPYLRYYDPSSLEYWEFDMLGTSCSAGCIRLQVKDAKWIYDNAYQIEAVEFYSSGDAGPFGKPTAPLISGNFDCRGWDPSDPDPNNPWITGKLTDVTENNNDDQITDEEKRNDMTDDYSLDGAVYSDDSSTCVIIYSTDTQSDSDTSL